MEDDIFYENDLAVTQSAMKMLRWLVIVFPALMLFSAIGLFQSKVVDLIPLTLMAVIVTMGPTVAYKLNASVYVMKYATTLALGCIVMLMATNSTIGIYMTYGLAMVFSIFYYDKKFTLRISIVSYVLLVVSLYFRSLNVQQVEFDSNFTWFASRSVGFLLEIVVMTIVCVKIADVSHKMLENLNDTKKVADLVEKCNDASVDFAEEVRVLAEDSKKSSDAISGIIEKIVWMLNEVQTANAQNITFVEEGIGQIYGAKEEAEKLGDLQSSSREMAEKVSESSVHTRDYSGQILQMADKMHSLVESSLNQADQIVQESKTQTNVTESVEDSFHQVSRVSKDLLAISSVQE